MSSSKAKDTLHTIEELCDKAILDTLHYRSVFDSSTTFNQLSTFLVSVKEFEHDLFKSRLQHLIDNKKVNTKNNKYYIFGKKTLNWDKRSKQAQKLMDHVDHTMSLLKKIGWIQLLAITGSVAAHNAHKNDDIDLFIIAKKGRVWLTRLYVVLVLKITNMYRTEKNFAKKICPNIFIDDSNLEWPKSKQNLYVAHEILLMHPVVNRNDAYFKFLKKNDWVFEFFPHYKIHLPKKFDENKSVDSKIIVMLEFLAMFFQLWYMKKRKTTETTSKSFIHFNTHDHSFNVLKKFSDFVSIR